MSFEGRPSPCFRSAITGSFRSTSRAIGREVRERRRPRPRPEYASRIAKDGSAAMPAFSRRSFLAASGGLALAALVRGALAQTAADRTRLILLGTAGGPARVKGGRKSPAQVIVVNGMAYVVDCGYEVAAQLIAAGIPLSRLRYIFITHHHSDHNAEYGNLFFIAWASGLRSPVHS